MSRTRRLTVQNLTERQIAKTIDHSLLRPELDDAFIEDGCRLAARYDVASVCVPPVHVARARGILAGTDVKVGTVVGFPHGYSTTDIKVAETWQVLAEGAREIDMVLRIGALRSGRDVEVEADIRAVVDVAHRGGAIVKVIFENAYLTDEEKIRACHAHRGRRRRFREDEHGVRGLRRDPRRPPPHAGEHVGSRPGQGGRWHPDARCADRGHEPRA